MYEGGCSCGQVRYRLTTGPMFVNCCHCTQCQKQSASAFGLAVPVPREVLSVDGPTSYWSRSTYSGGRTDCHFCTECGTRVFHARAGGTGFVTVKASAFDDTADLEPRAHLWVSMKLPWTLIPEGVEQYGTQPADLRAWRDGFLRP